MDRQCLVELIRNRMNMQSAVAVQDSSSVTSTLSSDDEDAASARKAAPKQPRFLFLFCFLKIKLEAKSNSPYLLFSRFLRPTVGDSRSFGERIRRATNSSQKGKLQPETKNLLPGRAYGIQLQFGQRERCEEECRINGGYSMAVCFYALFIYFVLRSRWRACAKSCRKSRSFFVKQWKPWNSKKRSTRRSFNRRTSKWPSFKSSWKSCKWNCK